MDSKWWCVIQVDNDLARYFRYWVDKQINPLGMKRMGLCEPSWGGHLSVVRGEKPRKDLQSFWKKHHNQIVDFDYQFDVQRPHGKEHFWFSDVRCPKAATIREELGLKTFYKFHMTIGRTY